MKISSKFASTVLQVFMPLFLVLLLSGIRRLLSRSASGMIRLFRGSLRIRPSVYEDPSATGHGAMRLPPGVIRRRHGIILSWDFGWVHIPVFSGPVHLSRNLLYAIWLSYLDPLSSTEVPMRTARICRARSLRTSRSMKELRSDVRNSTARFWIL